jgi:hypothetical protein
MNLYVGGCSFTYGHETKDNEATIKSHRPRWTWNDHLSNHFDGQLVNEAWPGGSNKRTVRRAMTFFNKVEDCNWVAVIQLTDPFNRFEYFDSTNNIFVSMIGDHYLLDDQHYNNMEVPFNLIKENSKKVLTYRNLLLTERELAIDYFQQIITQAMYFKQRNMPCLFVPMSSNCLPEMIVDRLVSTDIDQQPKSRLDAHLLELYKILPTDLFTVPISYMISDDDRENPPTDNHPNKTGHYKVYLYILNELQKRNYL